MYTDLLIQALETSGIGDNICAMVQRQQKELKHFPFKIHVSEEAWFYQQKVRTSQFPMEKKRRPFERSASW